MTACTRHDDCVECVVEKGKCEQCACPDLNGFFEKIVEQHTETTNLNMENGHLRVQLQETQNDYLFAKKSLSVESERADSNYRCYEEAQNKVDRLRKIEEAVQNTINWIDRMVLKNNDHPAKCETHNLDNPHCTCHLLLWMTVRSGLTAALEEKGKEDGNTHNL